MQWARTVTPSNPGGILACQECLLDEQVKPLDLRAEHPFPCAKHGDPRQLSIANWRAVEIYRRLPTETIQLDADRQKTVRRIDILTIDVLCGHSWLDVADDERFDLLDRLDIINSELNAEFYR